MKKNGRVRKLKAEQTALSGAGENQSEDVKSTEEEDNHKQPHGSLDICESLLKRYSKSSAPQHRHLCATACAMRSILSDEGLPLTPPAYLAAVLTALHDAEDRESISSLASFLSVLLPLVPVGSLPPSKRKDAILSTITPLLMRSDASQLPTPAVRSLISTAGFLILGFDADDWSSAKPPLETLLQFALDKRPKVRKIAQSCVQKSFSHFKASVIGKKYRKLLVSLFREHSSLCESTATEPRQGKRKRAQCPLEMLQILQLMKRVTPNFPKKKIAKLVPEVYAILRHKAFCLQALSLLEVMLKHTRDDDLILLAEKISSSLISCLPSNQSPPHGVVISISSLLKDIFCRISHVRPSISARNLSTIFVSIASHLDSKNEDVSKHVSMILKEMLGCDLDPDATVIQDLSNFLEKQIRACSGTLNAHVLAVSSELFLKLGASSVQFMKGIILELGRRMLDLVGDLGDVGHLHECLGSAITAIGPEKMLHLFPMHFDEEKLTCSNSWLIPLLRKYVSGSSLGFFMEHIVPLAMHLKKYCRKGKGSSASVKDIETCIRGLWDLLPAFCHYAIDVSENFDSLAKLLVSSIMEDVSLHKPITFALQLIVKENTMILQKEKDGENTNSPTAGATTACDNIRSFGLRNVECCYSEEDATKNVEALRSNSKDLFIALVDAFHSSSLENRQHLKSAIECLAPLVGSSLLQNNFNSLLENIDVEAEASNENEGKKGNRKNGRSVLMELVSSFVAGADGSLLGEIYNFIKPFVLDKDGSCSREACLILFKILKEHPWFAIERITELLDLLTGKKPYDINVFKIYLSCLHLLLVYLLKCDDDKMEEKAFLILNEVIVTLKDSRKEIRESAYGLLFGILGSLEDSKINFPGSPLHKLLAMIMAYFSSKSPQITSGAVSALSLLVYKDSEICIYESSLLPSIAMLLGKKDREVIKASLGFVKVLVSSLKVTELNKFLPDIVKAIMPWSLVSKNHFRTKVTIIFEIMMRKCGFATINMLVPDKYRDFIRNIQDHRRKKMSSNEEGISNGDKLSGDVPNEGSSKRKNLGRYSETHPETKRHKAMKLFKTQKRGVDSGGERNASRSSSHLKDKRQNSKGKGKHAKGRIVPMQRKKG